MKASQASVAPRLATTRAEAAITPAMAAHASASPQDESASAGLLGSSLLLIRDHTAVVASRAAHAAATADRPTSALHTSFSFNTPPSETTYKKWLPDSGHGQTGSSGSRFGVEFADGDCVTTVGLISKEQMACKKCGRRASFLSPLGPLCPSDALWAAAFHEWIPEQIKPRAAGTEPSPSTD